MFRCELGEDRGKETPGDQTRLWNCSNKAQRRRNKGEARQGSSGGAPGDWEPLIKHLIKEMVTRCVVLTLALPEKKKINE